MSSIKVVSCIMPLSAPPESYSKFFADFSKDKLECVQTRFFTNPNTNETFRIETIYIEDDENSPNEQLKDIEKNPTFVPLTEDFNFKCGLNSDDKAKQSGFPFAVPVTISKSSEHCNDVSSDFKVIEQSAPVFNQKQPRNKKDSRLNIRRKGVLNKQHKKAITITPSSENATEKNYQFGDLLKNSVGHEKNLVKVDAGLSTESQGDLLSKNVAEHVKVAVAGYSGFENPKTVKEKTANIHTQFSYNLGNTNLSQNFKVPMQPDADSFLFKKPSINKQVTVNMQSPANLNFSQHIKIATRPGGNYSDCKNVSKVSKQAGNIKTQFPGNFDSTNLVQHIKLSTSSSDRNSCFKSIGIKNEETDKDNIQSSGSISHEMNLSKRADPVSSCLKNDNVNREIGKLNYDPHLPANPNVAQFGKFSDKFISSTFHFKCNVASDEKPADLVKLSNKQSSLILSEPISTVNYSCSSDANLSSGTKTAIFNSDTPRDSSELDSVQQEKIIAGSVTNTLHFKDGTVMNDKTAMLKSKIQSQHTEFVQNIKQPAKVNNMLCSKEASIIENTVNVDLKNSSNLLDTNLVQNVNLLTKDLANNSSESSASNSKVLFNLSHKDQHKKLPVMAEATESCIKDDDKSFETNSSMNNCSLDNTACLNMERAKIGKFNRNVLCLNSGTSEQGSPDLSKKLTQNLINPNLEHFEEKNDYNLCSIDTSILNQNSSNLSMPLLGDKVIIKSLPSVEENVSDCKDAKEYVLGSGDLKVEDFKEPNKELQCAPDSVNNVTKVSCLPNTMTSGIFSHRVNDGSKIEDANWHIENLTSLEKLLGEIKKSVVSTKPTSTEDSSAAPDENSGIKQHMSVTCQETENMMCMNEKPASLLQNETTTCNFQSSSEIPQDTDEAKSHLFSQSSETYNIKSVIPSFNIETGSNQSLFDDKKSETKSHLGNQESFDTLSEKNQPFLEKLVKPLLKYLKNNKCLICGFVFTSHDKSAANRHLSIHLTDKIFKCYDCGRTFSTPDNLKVHKKMHADVKENDQHENIKEESCERKSLESDKYKEKYRGFKVSGGCRKRHSNQRVTPNILSKCKYCKKTFNFKINLIQHLTVCKSNKINSESCGYLSGTSNSKFRFHKLSINCPKAISGEIAESVGFNKGATVSLTEDSSKQQIPILDLKTNFKFKIHPVESCSTGNIVEDCVDQAPHDSIHEANSNKIPSTDFNMKPVKSCSSKGALKDCDEKAVLASNNEGKETNSSPGNINVQHVKSYNPEADVHLKEQITNILPPKVDFDNTETNSEKEFVQSSCITEFKGGILQDVALLSNKPDLGSTDSIFTCVQDCIETVGLISTVESNELVLPFTTHKANTNEKNSDVTKFEAEHNTSDISKTSASPVSINVLTAGNKERCSETERYPCKFCKEIFSLKWSYIQHLESQHKGSHKLTVCCEICDLDCVHWSAWLNHVLSHEADSNKTYRAAAFKFHNCVLNHISKLGCLDRHNYQCKLCKKIFTQRTNFVLHSELHADSLEITCGDCDKGFMYWNNLLSHILSHRETEAGSEQ